MKLLSGPRIFRFFPYNHYIETYPKVKSNAPQERYPQVGTARLLGRFGLPRGPDRSPILQISQPAQISSQILQLPKRDQAGEVSFFCQ